MTVVDLNNGKALGEIETSGCTGALLSGPRRFQSLCGDGAMLTVALPPGAREVALRYDIASYHLGVKVSIVMLLLTAGLCLADRLPLGKVNG